MSAHSRIFESHRAELQQLASRMLGDIGAAQDVVQDAWLRWEGHATEVIAPRAYLVKTVIRLCLNEMNSARARKEVPVGPRLPEPVATTMSDDFGLYEGISMAFLVVLERLSPAERAVLLLHDVFAYSHAEVAEILGKTQDASRQLLHRAKRNIGGERPRRGVCVEEHQRLLAAFALACRSGDTNALLELFTDDVTLVVDVGEVGRRFGGVNNLPGPLVGARKVAAFAASVTPQGATGLSVRVSELNGQPALVMERDGTVDSAILLSVRDTRICGVFIYADPASLRSIVTDAN